MKIDWNEKPDGISMVELRDFTRRAVSNNEFRITRLESIIFREQRRALRQASSSDVLAIVNSRLMYTSDSRIDGYH